jgi:transposase
MIATALLATIGDASHFANGRQMAASLGLTPKQNSSGGKERLLGISKRGDAYLRSLLVHGANQERTLTTLLTLMDSHEYKAGFQLGSFCALCPPCLCICICRQGI